MLYEVFTECDMPEYDSFIVDVDGLVEADEEGMRLMRDKYPEGRHFAVEEIKALKDVM